MYLLLDVCVCTRSQPGGQRAEAYINHKLSGCGFLHFKRDGANQSVSLGRVRVCCTAASEGTSLGSVPVVAACGIFGLATRAF